MIGSVCAPQVVSASHKASRVSVLLRNQLSRSLRYLAPQVLNQVWQLGPAMLCNNQPSAVQAACKHSFKPVKRLHVLRRPLRERSQQASRRCRQCSGTPVQTKAAGNVFALDFDGVMVDSEPEISSSAVTAAAEYWPEQFGNLDQATHDQLRHNMRQVRPVLVNGVEALVMARMVLEDPGCVDTIIQDWQSVLPATLNMWKVEQKDLQIFFEDFRNNLLQNKEDEWVKRHVMYPGLQETLKACKYPWYIVTSRAKHRTLKLVDAMLDMQWPEDTPRLYCKLLPPNQRKIETLQEILDKPMVKEQNATIHFVDDRYETVKAVAGEPSLSKVQVYMADWGYSTQAEKDAAKETKGVRVISLTQFQELLNWGILMGVDDGCGDDD